MCDHDECGVTIDRAQCINNDGHDNLRTSRKGDIFVYGVSDLYTKAELSEIAKQK